MNKIHHIFWDAVKKIFIFDFCGHIFVLKSRREVRGLEGGRGGYFGNFWVGMCYWDTGTLSLHHSYFS